MKDLKAKRVRLGISQKAFADILGITPEWLNTLENKKKRSAKLEKRIIDKLEKIEQENFGISIPTL